MRTLRIILALLALVLGVSTGRAQSFTAPITGTGGGGGTLTGSVWFPGPFSVSGTNWYLASSISNLAINNAFTNANMVYSNTIVVNAGPDALVNGAAMTNAVKYAGTLATGGRTILVHVTRGEYWTPTNTVPSVMMAVDNVSTYWEPGAKWYSGKVTAGSDTAHMWDDSAGKTTNVNIYGWGEFYLTNNSASIVSLESGSTMTVECQEAFASESASAGSGGATTFNFLTLPATFTANVRGTIHSVTYDAIYFNASEGHKVNIKARKISSTFGDILEASGSAANWGDVVIEADVMERTATTGATYLSTAYIPQPSMMKIGGNVIIRSGSVNCYSTNGCIYAGSETNYGLLANAVIKVAGNARRGVLDDGSATGTGHTGVWLKNCSLYGPTNLDVMNLTNQTTLPTILDNCTIYPGFASTNWARGITPSSVVILGSLNIYPWKPAAANITILGTNNTPAIYNIGDFTQMGVSKFSNDVTVAASVFKLAGVTTLDVDAEAYVNNFFVTNLFYLPFLHNGAAVDGTGAMMQKSNAWATGRGTLMFNDQTADVKVVAALASDTPSNGQVPVWNTGGTITWETPTGGSGSTNMVTAEIGRLNITNGVVMTGTAIPLFALPSYQGDATAFTRATNSPASTGTTNDLQFSQSATAGQVMSVHSSANGQIVWTNATPAASESALEMGEVRTFDGTNYVSTNQGWALNYPPNLGYTRMVFKGDSLTLGSGGGTPYHTYLTNLYLTTTNYIFSTNAGVGGQTAATMNSNFAQDIGNYVPSGGTNGLLFLWGGINDLGAGTSAATTYASLTNIYGKAKTNGTGWTIVAFTVSGAMTLTSAQEHQRHLLNNLIRNSPWWDYLVDVAAYVPGPPESGWYADYIHFSNAGYSAIATLVSETLQRGKRNLFTPFPMDASKQFKGSGAVRGLNTSIYASDSIPGLTLENSSTSDILTLLPISSGLVNLYYKVGSGNFAASDVRETISLGAHSFNMNVASATNVIATNSFVLPSAQVAAPYGLTTQGAQIWSDGTNLLLTLQNSGGTRTTNKLLMTAWP